MNASTGVAILALVFAMTGGAYAAKRYLISSTSQLSPRVLKELEAMAGKAGAPGAPGPQGPAGSAGTQGPAGPKGEPGAPGTPGKPGKAGKEGREGKEGEAGAEGSPWTAGGTLPSGASETGTWSLSPAGELFIPISFTIPLKASLPKEKIEIFEGGTPPPGCKGSTVENGFVTSLKAEPGFLCVYLRFGAGTGALVPFDSEKELGTEGAGKDGLVLYSGSVPSGTIAYGTWAVTAP